ncbi:hypothetical protein SK128_001625 [Halocaridina rubra]|uniref:Uncharacterized protein n=1 Tax=Halocaridina rubra TaxID=373956 RepID=A0AAN9A119_HALRR
MADKKTPHNQARTPRIDCDGGNEFYDEEPHEQSCHSKESTKRWMEDDYVYEGNVERGMQTDGKKVRDRRYILLGAIIAQR